MYTTESDEDESDSVGESCCGQPASTSGALDGAAAAKSRKAEGAGQLKVNDKGRRIFSTRQSQWLVGQRVRVLDDETNCWFPGVVVRTAEREQADGQKRWIVCFPDGPRTVLLLLGKWKCDSNDFPAGLTAIDPPELDVAKGGTTRLDGAGKNMDSAVSLAATAAAYSGVS